MMATSASPSMNRDDGLLLIVYALGACVLTWLGPALWGVSQGVAVISAWGAAGVFILTHLSLRIGAGFSAIWRNEGSGEEASPLGAGERPSGGFNLALAEAEAPSSDEPEAPKPAGSPPVELLLQPVVALRDGRARHFLARFATGGVNWNETAADWEAASDANRIDELADLALGWGARSAETRLMVRVSNAGARDARALAHLRDTLQRHPELRARLLLIAGAAVTAELAAIGFATGTLIDAPIDLAGVDPGSTLFLTEAALAPLRTADMKLARRLGINVIGWNLSREIAAEAALLGVVLAWGDSFGEARAPVRTEKLATPLQVAA
ncbi:hypothetical protein [Pacificimonas flava]|nr:hypothetical protein [Pacificimonas flava]MBB5281326.1 hypothetical protein [Pacificimonas flava]